MTREELLINRCFDLAQLGLGKTSSKSITGSVITNKLRIIGEGFQKKYNGPHAEEEAINSIDKKNIIKLSESTIYTSLEPCNTSKHSLSCSDLILAKNIPNIVISTIDQTSEINRQSIKKLQKAGRTVTTGIFEESGNSIVRIRNTFITKKRPFITIKYAKSLDGYIGKKNQAIWMTNGISKRLTHKWRSEMSAIMVGTNTALVDNPRLSNRLYFGKSPLRIVLDKKARLPHSLALFDGSVPTWIVGEKRPKNPLAQNTDFVSLNFDEQLIPSLLTKLWEENHDSLLVEGGAYLINSFLQLGLWDEIRMFTANTTLEEGIKAPIINQLPSSVHQIGSDQLEIFTNQE